MIRSPEDIRHGLAHLEIGEIAVLATTGDQPQIPLEAVAVFFENLRQGHRKALANYDPELGKIIGDTPHEQFARFGMYGKFAGQLALIETREVSGLAIIERKLHHATPPGLQAELRSSLTNAVKAARS
jgi:hypothetical protein